MEKQIETWIIGKDSTEFPIKTRILRVIDDGINAPFELDVCDVLPSTNKKEHIKVIIDAGNTFQQTNKLPSELAEANKELLDALKLLLDGSTAPEWKKETCIKVIKKHSNA